MKRRKISILKTLKVVIQLLVCFLPFVACSKEETPAIFQRSVLQYPFFKSPHGFNNDDHLLKRKALYLTEKLFQIQPSDAIDVTKYSRPIVERLNDSSIRVPTLTLSEVMISSLPVDQRSISRTVPEKNTLKPTKDSKFIESSSEIKSFLSESSLQENFEIQVNKKFDFQSGLSKELSLPKAKHPNNFSDHEASLLPVSSDEVLSYQLPSRNKEETVVEEKSNVQVKNESSQFSEENQFFYSSQFIPTTPLSLSKADIVVDYHNRGIMNSTENTFDSLLTPAVQDKINSSSVMPSTEQEGKLSSGTVAGIVIAVLVSVTLLSSTVIYLLYKKYNGKCTSVVESKFNTDNGGYLDDSLRSSIYLNNHIELPKESSEEMSSLDNDSFLNSLETMTIQNYWADNSKNTKV